LRVAYLGPPGTVSDEALSAAAPDVEAVPLASLRDVVLSVQEGRTERALAPIENALEGGVDPVLDALALEAPDVTLTGEIVQPVSYCLAAGRQIELAEIKLVRSHPQALGQCTQWIARNLPNATVLPAASTADAVREVAESGDGTVAAIGPRLAADLYGATILAEGIEDHPGNETRFVWLARRGDEPASQHERRKTSVVFWGGGDAAPGWLVRCLSELAFRGINLTRIESRPRRMGLGHYMFFVDLEGAADAAPVAEALAALETHCEGLRTLGTYPAARR